MNIVEYFQRQTAELIRLPVAEQRFVYYYPTDHTGWGNQLRGFVLSLLISLASRRILVVRDFLIEEHFLPPEGCRWDYASWKMVLRALEPETQEIVLHLSPSDWDETAWQSYASRTLDDLFPARVVSLHAGAGFSDQLMINPQYADLWRTLGLDVTSKISWLGTLCRAFLNRPSDKLVRRYQRLKRGLALDQGAGFGVVQFRTFYDIGSPRLSLVDAFADEVIRLLQQDTWTGRRLLIATDDAKATRHLTATLGAMTPAMASRTKVVHTGYTYAGLLRLVERFLRKALRRDIWIPDLWLWLPASMRPRPHTATLAEWFLYGDAEFAISSFTSFAGYAFARAGNVARLYRFDAETRAVGPMTDEHYFF